MKTTQLRILQVQLLILLTTMIKIKLLLEQQDNTTIKFCPNHHTLRADTEKIRIHHDDHRHKHRSLRRHNAIHIINMGI